MFQWCSFADSDLPAGTQFLGVVITEASDVIEAVTKCHRLGINPGGEVLALALPPNVTELVCGYKDRLLPAAEAQELSDMITAAMGGTH